MIELLIQETNSQLAISTLVLALGLVSDKLKKQKAVTKIH